MNHTYPVAPQAGPAPGLDLRRLLVLLRRNLLIVAAVALLAIGLAVVKNRAAVNEYQATTVLSFAPVTSAAQLVTGQTPAATSPDYVSEQLTLVKAEPVLAAAVDAVGGFTVQELAEQTEVTRQGETSFVEVSVSGPDAVQVAAAADAIADAFVTQRLAATQATLTAVQAQLQAQAAELQARITALAAGVVVDPTTGIQLDPAALVQLQGVQGQYAAVDDQLRSVTTQLAFLQSDARVIERAEVPESPVSPRPLVTLILAAVLGSLAGVLLAVVIEKLRDRITNVDEAQDLVGVPLLATFTEAGPLPTVEVIGPGDLAGQLAAVAAAGGASVLVAGASGREPALEAATVVAASYAASGARVSFTSLDTAIAPDRVTTVLPAPPTQPGRALPPVPLMEPQVHVVHLGSLLTGIEAARWAHQVDRVIVVTRPGATRRRDLLQACGVVRATGAPLAGLVTARRGLPTIDPAAPSPGHWAAAFGYVDHDQPADPGETEAPTNGHHAEVQHR